MAAPPINIPYKHTRCRMCLGRGAKRVVDGLVLRSIREKAGVSLRDMADHLAVSLPYMSDLELGRRKFTDEIARKYLMMCKRAAAKKGEGE